MGQRCFVSVAEFSRLFARFPLWFFMEPFKANTVQRLPILVTGAGTEIFQQS